MSRLPISMMCPKCESKEYTSRKPEALVAFARDRVCKVCQVRYSPPPPVWGGIVFLISGLALPVLGLVLTALLVHPFSIPGLACEGAFCLFAVVVFIGGIRALIDSRCVGAVSVGDSSRTDHKGRGDVADDR